MRLDARTEFEILELLAKGGGVEAGRVHSCTAMCTTTALGTTSFTPPFGEGSKILNSLRASDLAWLPPTAHGNCSEAARTFAISLPPQCRDLC